MGTLVRITLYAPDSDSARKGFAAAFERIRALDETLSDYKATSELSRLRAGAPIPVSEDLFRLLSAAQDLARETRGPSISHSARPSACGGKQDAPTACRRQKNAVSRCNVADTDI